MNISHNIDEKLNIWGFTYLFSELNWFINAFFCFSHIPCIYYCAHNVSTCLFMCTTCASQDLLHGRIQMKTLTNKWYEEVRQGPSGSEDDEDEAELL